MPRRYRSGWRNRSAFKPTELSAAQWALSHGIHLWSKQVEICDAVAEHKMTICKGGHQWGKSLVSAVVAAHWIQSHPRDEVGVAIVAPTWNQIVDGILLEVDRLRVNCKLPGRINLSKQHAHWDIDGRKVIVCRSPQQGVENAQTITGLHRRFLLVIFEEGCGLDRDTWRNGESWALNDTSRVLSIGNPLDESTAFGDAFKDDSAYHQMSVSTMDSPAFTGEPCPQHVLDALAGKTAIEQWRATMTAADFAARVEGEFPSATQLQIFSRALIDKCKALKAGPSDSELRLGLDPAFGGGDTCRLTAYRRPALWDVTPKEIRRGADEETIAKHVAGLAKELGACGVNVDGLGAGDITKYIEAHGMPAKAIMTGRPARRPQQFGNMRSEMHSNAKKAMMRGEVALSANREMEEEFLSVRQKLKPDRRFWVEPKEEHAKRIGRSPGAFDSALLALKPFVSGYGIASHAA